MPLLAAAVALVALQAPPPPQQPVLVVLTDTGKVEGGLPVVVPAANAAEHERVLTRGFSGRLLWLYQREQEYLRRRDGTPPAPAYLVLTANQGGFPRKGFVLNGVAQRSAAYVDLLRQQTISGRFGANDQIFPHELLHVILKQLSGAPPPGGANQVHAIGVRTDPQVAFDDGFAETMQVLAIDDPDALPETAALARDAAARSTADRNISRYRNAMESWISIAPKALMAFPIWYSGTEQALRYYAVRENRFVFEAPSSGLLRRSLYRAYLVDSIVPGLGGSAVKSAARGLATEGVVAALMWRLVTDAALQQRVPDDSFYANFGATGSEVRPVENAFLKSFHVLSQRRPHDAASFVAAWRDVFPADAPALDRVTRDVLGEVPRAPSTELWLLSERLQTGTTVFDQFRGMKRPHTFDLNAASDVDLYSLEAMTADAARRLRAAAPYRGVNDVRRAGVSDALMAEIDRASTAMRALQSKSGEEESVSINAILMPYVWRVAVVWGICGAAAAFVFRRVRGHGAWRSALSGAACALVALAAAWTIDPTEGWLALGAPVLLLGVPAALVDLARYRLPSRIPRVVLVWALAALPSLVVVHPLF